MADSHKVYKRALELSPQLMGFSLPSQIGRSPDNFIGTISALFFSFMNLLDFHQKNNWYLWITILLSTVFSISCPMPSSMAVSSTSAASLAFSSSSIFISSSSQRTPKLKLVPLSKSLETSFKSLTITSQLATLPIFSFPGEKIGETFLDLKSAPPETARAVVHRAIIHDLQNKRRGTASTLTRGEVRGGGKKPYGQKKTGRARMGSIRTPLRPGGGVVFGPKPKDWSIKMNKKEKQLAISTALASATESMIVVEDFGEKFEKPRTKDFIEAMRRWGLDPKVKAMFLMKQLMDNVKKSGRNIGTLKMLTPRTLNLFDILDAEKLVLTPETVDFLNGRYGVNAKEEYEEEEEVDDNVPG